MTEDYCFVIIPFKDDFKAIGDAIHSAVSDVTDDDGEQIVLDCRRGDTVLEAAVIPDHIRSGIENSRFCIAVITEHNPNVLWEVGYAHAKGKPVILLAEHPESAPFDVRHMRIMRYSSENPEAFKGELVETIKATVKVGTPISLLSKMIVPSTLPELSREGPFVVAASPLSWREAQRAGGGFKMLRRTSSDHVGICGLLQSFKFIDGFRDWPDLIDPNDYRNKALKAPMNLYCIGSPKANRWTGRSLRQFNKYWLPKLEFRADPCSNNLRNVRVMVHKNGMPYRPDDVPREKPYNWDFGLIIRGPNPFHPDFMLTIIAGNSSLGTEAACRAATSPTHLAEIRNIVRARSTNFDLDDYRQPFYAVVNMQRDTLTRAPAKQRHEALVETLKVSTAKAFRVRPSE